MKLKRRPDGNRGFTIIEVMIVLAVTSLMFISIVLLVNGRQQEAQFHTAINNVQSQIEQVINETANGYYPSANFNCDSGAGGPTPLHISNSVAAVDQGTRQGCVFLGKAIHFNDGSTNFAVYPFAGLQTATTATTPGPLYTARPTVITQSISTLPLEGGLTVKYMKYVDATTHTTTTAGSMAFMQSFSAAASATTGGSSGSQNLDLVMPTGGASSITNTAEVNTLNNAFETVQSPFSSTYATSALAPATSAQICFNSGTTQQSGLITVGDSLNGLAVTLKIFSQMDCS